MVVFFLLTLFLSIEMFFFFFTNPPTPEFSPLPLHAALPLSWAAPRPAARRGDECDVTGVQRGAAPHQQVTRLEVNARRADVGAQRPGGVQPHGPALASGT